MSWKWALLLVIIVLVGITLVYLLRRFLESRDEAPESENVLLLHFRDLYEKGELDAQEFQEVRTKLAKQMHEGGVGGQE